MSNGRKVSFIVPGEAQPAGSNRAFVIPGTNRASVTDANPKAKGYKQTAALFASQAMAAGRLQPFEGPLILTVAFYRRRPKSHYTGSGKLSAKGVRTPYPTGKPDATKLLRGLEDALTGICWADDSQVVCQYVEKRYGPHDATYVVVEQIADATPLPAVIGSRVATRPTKEDGNA
jgi:crossover junction endodeoxyribonuclease RusA